MEILPDEVLDGNAPLVDAEVALAKDVGFKVQQKRERVAVLLAVREQGRVQGAVDVLTKQHSLPRQAGSVDQRAGRVAGAVEGDHLLSPTAMVSPLGGDLVIDREGPHAGAVPVGGGHGAVARLEVDGVFGVGDDAAVVVVAHGRGPSSRGRSGSG